MFIVDLVCSAAHLFEGWYDNKEAFDDARRARSLSCPVCGDVDVEQRPSFRGIVSRSSSPPRRRAHRPVPTTEATTTTNVPATTQPLPLEVQRQLSKLIKLVKAHSEDAGEAFAARALAMHKGDEQPTPIYGSSTPDEQQTLLDEGVPFAVLPVPDIDNN